MNEFILRATNLSFLTGLKTVVEGGETVDLSYKKIWKKSLNGVLKNYEYKNQKYYKKNCSWASRTETLESMKIMSIPINSPPR